MVRKFLLVSVIVSVLLVMVAQTAMAGGGWDLIHDRSGHGRVTLRAWTRGYNQVAFVSDHAGTRIDVEVVVNCRNGDHFENTWSDGGRRFRFILRGLSNSGRCNHTFRVSANDSFPPLYLALYARG
jgi:hypothetical protein